MREGMRATYLVWERAIVRWRLHEPKGLVVFLIAIMALRALLQDVFYAVTDVPVTMFFFPWDRFADTIAAALSYCDLNHICATHAAESRHWDPIFRQHIGDPHSDNSDANLNGQFLWTQAATGFTHFTSLHAPPINMLLYQGCLWLMWTLGPAMTLVILFAAYVVLVLAAAQLCAKLFVMPSLERPLIFLFCLSYPALWMMTRANSPAGFSAVLTMLWLATTWSGRLRPIGWLSLALAVNFRPEPALLVLFELLTKDKFRVQFTRMAIPGALTLLIAVIAYQIDTQLYSHYTIDRIRKALAIYHHEYVIGFEGNIWNSSLYMVPKLFFYFQGRGAPYNPMAASIIHGAGLVALALCVWAAFVQRIDRAHLAFATAAIPALFVPVFGYYHMLSFIPVLVALLLDFAVRPPVAGDRRLPLLLLTALVMSPLGGAYTNGLLDDVVLLIGLALCAAQVAQARRSVNVATA